MGFSPDLGFHVKHRCTVYVCDCLFIISYYWIIILHWYNTWIIWSKRIIISLLLIHPPLSVIQQLWPIGSPPVHTHWVIHSISCVNYSLFTTVNENSFHSFSHSSSFSNSLCKCVYHYLARSILCRSTHL